jgi:hypothetical protein
MVENTDDRSKRPLLIPTEIIEAWAKGDYYSGDAPSLSYKQMGAALSLRGWYTYDQCTKDDPSFKGVAKIELKGKHILLGGIRLCGQDSYGVQSIRFWRSQYSYFYSEKEIVWVYSVYDTPVDESVFKEYLGDPGAFPDMKSKTADDRFGFEKPAWAKLLNVLRDSFDAHIMTIEEKCPEDRVNKVLLHFNIEKKIGEYRALYRPDGSNIAGNTCFKRADVN